MRPGPAGIGLERLRDDAGTTMLELAIAAGIFLMAAAAIAGVLVVTMRVGKFAQTESAAIDDGRIAAAGLQRDVRNALGLATCEPVGYCLRVYSLSPRGDVSRLQYRAVQPDPGRPGVLYRDAACEADYSSCPSSRAVVTDLANLASGTPVFSCVSSASYLYVDITLVLSPLSNANTGTLRVESSARPRNVSAAFC